MAVCLDLLINFEVQKLSFRMHHKGYNMCVTSYAVTLLHRETPCGLRARDTFFGGLSCMVLCVDLLINFELQKLSSKMHHKGCNMCMMSFVESFTA